MTGGLDDQEQGLGTSVADHASLGDGAEFLDCCGRQWGSHGSIRVGGAHSVHTGSCYAVFAFVHNIGSRKAQFHRLRRWIGLKNM